MRIRLTTLDRGGGEGVGGGVCVCHVDGDLVGIMRSVYDTLNVIKACQVATL